MRLNEPDKFEAEILTSISIKGSNDLICEFTEWCYNNRVFSTGGGVGPFWCYGSYRPADAKRVLKWLRDRKCSIQGEHDGN